MSNLRSNKTGWNLRNALVSLLLSATAAMAGSPKTLAYTPAPVDNPLKGLVPYAGDLRDRFPHSMEFNYLPLAALVKGPDSYDWSALERLLDSVAARGHQAVFRVYLEYPGQTNVIPSFLIEAGLKVHKYLNTNTQPLPPREVVTPDYEDASLRKTLAAFIRELGRRYDGDRRIGFITAGLLGTWGEWHTYPRNELFASKEVQSEIMDACEAAFRITPVLLRYPAGENDSGHASNVRRRLGYHDDSFAWATLDTGRKQDDWFFMPSMRRAEAVAKWRTQPVGGEIRPEAWGKVFDENPGDSRIQDFRQCVEQTHATWLMDSGMFGKNQPEARRARALELVRRMGYELQIARVALEFEGERKLGVTLSCTNHGVAPFYYNWPLEFALQDESGKLLRTFPCSGKLTAVIPGEPADVWRDTLDVGSFPNGDYELLLRARNPLPNGKPLRFANQTQDKDLPGWLTLSRLALD